MGEDARMCWGCGCEFAARRARGEMAIVLCGPCAEEVDLLVAESAVPAKWKYVKIKQNS